MTKTLEVLFSSFAIIGAILVSNTLVIGWLFWLVSSVLGIIWGYRTKNYWICVMQIFFTITNIIGCINYLPTMS